MVRKVFDELTAKNENLGARFVELYLESPKERDVEKLAAQVLDEEERRQRFSGNERIKAAHKAMKEISEDAAAEFRRVIGIMGEDADLSQITQKIREQFEVHEADSKPPNVREMPDALKHTNLEDEARMTEREIVEELGKMGLRIYGGSGGPYRIIMHDGTPIAMPRNSHELRAFLKEKRRAVSGSE